MTPGPGEFSGNGEGGLISAALPSAEAVSPCGPLLPSPFWREFPGMGKLGSPAAFPVFLAAQPVSRSRQSSAQTSPTGLIAFVTFVSTGVAVH